VQGHRFAGLLSGLDNWMVERRGGISDRCADVVSLQEGEVGEDLFVAHAAGDHLEDVDYTHAHATDAWCTVALIGADRYAGHEIAHELSIAEPN